MPCFAKEVEGSSKKVCEEVAVVNGGESLIILSAKWRDSKEKTAGKGPRINVQEWGR